MYKYRSSILQELEAYGFIHAIAKPEKLDAILCEQKITLYTGFDLTAPSLHLGNLMQLMFARKFLKYGHNIILLLGGATTRIGDPTGKNETRKVLSLEQIQNNKAGIIKDISNFIDISSPAIKILDNSEWFLSYNYLDFLREVGTHFTINRMLAMESVKLRLERGSSMNFVEFNYMLLQGYDFAYLNKNYNCVLQIGGSDQWGNITEGMELCARMNQSESFALCSPLLTRSDGKKMGKSESGAIFLSENLTDTFAYFQYFRNIPDPDVPNMLRYYTELPISQIDLLTKNKGKAINEGKKVLAFEVTKLARGEAEALKALKEAENVFSQNLLPEDENCVFFARPGDDILKTLLINGAIKSLTEGRRLIKQGAVKLNDSLLPEDRFVFEKSEEIKVTLGKKKRYKIIIK